MRKKYPEAVNQMYELILEYTEEVETLVDRLKNKEIKMFEKINALMESVSETVPDTEELVEQALDDGRPPSNEPVFKNKPHWNEELGQWSDQKPQCGELF